MKCAGQFSGLQDGRATADPAADRHWRVEAYFVAAEIYCASKIFDLDEVSRQCRNQSQGEIPVSDRLAIGQLYFRPLGVDMDPLKIAGRLGEAVYFLLIDFDPVGQSDFLAFQRFRIFN